MHTKNWLMVLVTGLVVSGFSAVDTLKTTNLYSGHFKVNIETIGLVENNVMFASEAVTGDDVLILNVAPITQSISGVYHDSITLAKIPRSHRTLKSSGEAFTVLKEGNLIFFNDSNDLKIYDVTDLKNPVLKHSVNTGSAILHFTKVADTIYVSQATSKDIKVYTYDKNSNPKLVLTISGEGGGICMLITNIFLDTPIPFRSGIVH